MVDNIDVSLLDLIQGTDVEWKPFGEVAELKRGTSVTKKTAVEGKYPVISGGQQPAYFIDKFNREGETITIAGSGAYAGFVMFWNEPIFVSDAFSVKTNKKIVLPRYAYHFLLSIQDKIYALKSGGGVPHVYAKDVARFEIPIPSLEIQKKVVEILDKMTDYVTELTAELTAELTLRQKQYAYYRAQLLTFPNPGVSDESVSVKWMTLGDISSMISTGVTPKAGNPDYYENGTIPWLRTNEVKFNEIYSTEKLVTQKAFDETSIKWVPENSVIVAISGATAGRVAINKIPLTTNQHCCCISLNNSQVDYKFVYHWLVKQNDKILDLKQGARGDLNMGMLRSFKIPVPSLSDQKRIVEILDKFDKLTSDLSEGLPREIRLRQKQYEYWREQLLSFRNNI